MIHSNAGTALHPRTTAATKNAVSEDLLRGAEEIAEYLFGDSAKRRSVYHLAQSRQLPVFKLGSMLCARRSTLLAWIEEQVPQCGYCQSGQIMQAAALLKNNKKPTRDEIVGFMRGNICRCGTYIRIIKAIERASQS